MIEQESTANTDNVILDYRNREHESTLGNFQIPVSNLISHPNQRFTDPDQVKSLMESFLNIGIVASQTFIAFAPKDWNPKDGVLEGDRFEVVSGNHRLKALLNLKEKGGLEFDDPKVLVKVLGRGKYPSF